MKKKVEFTTFEDSPLAIIVTRLDEKLTEILALDKKNNAKPNLERAYALKQLVIIKNNIEDIKNLLSYFSEGNGPGLMSLPFHNSAHNLNTAIKKSTEFFSSEFVAFKRIKKQLKGLIPKTSNTIKTVPVTMNGQMYVTLDKKNEFANLLKQKLRQGPKNRFEASEKIPGWNENQFFINLDLAIDKFFDNSNVITIDKKGLIDRLTKMLINYISNILFGSIAPGKYERLKLDIVDQLTYDFAVEILKLLEMLPETLEEFIPFFNPPVITEGMIPDLVSKIFDISIKNIPNELNVNQEKRSSYAYEISEQESNWSEIFDLSELYFNHKDTIKNLLAPVIADYLANYAHRPHVKSELAKGQPASHLVKTYMKPKAKLMTEFIKREKNLEARCLSVLNNSLILDSETSLKLRLDYLELAQHKFRKLEKRKADYQITPFKNLMNKHGDQFVFKNARLNPELPLPAVIIARNKEKNYETVIVAEELKLSSALVEQYSKLNAKINEVKMLIKREQEELFNQEIAKYEKENFIITEELINLFNAASFEPLQIVGSLAEQIKTIEIELDRLNNQIALLPMTINKVKSIEEFLNKPVECPENLQQFNLMFSEKAFNCYNSGRDKAKEIIGQLSSFEVIYQTQKQELSSALEKVNVEIRFAERMKCSDPTPVFEKIVLQKQNKTVLESQAQTISDLIATKELNEKDFDRKLKLNSSESCTRNIETSYTLVKIHLNISMLDALDQFTAGERFKLESLKTVESVKEASVWLSAELTKYKEEYSKFQQSAKINLSNSINAIPPLLNAITIAKNLIENAQKINNFPFKELNTALENCYNVPLWQRIIDDGFELLLNQLNDSNHTFSKWKSYKDLPYIQIKEEVNSLLLFLTNKFAQTQAKFADLTKLFIYENEAKNLAELERLLKNLSAAHEELLNRDLLIKQKNELVEEIKNLNTEVNSKNNELKSLDIDLNILNSIAELLQKNQNLTQSIVKIENEKSVDILLLIQKQEIINPMLFAARDTLLEISKQYKNVSAEVSQLENKQSYTENLITINSLLEESKTKISKAENDICTTKFNDLRSSINDNKDQLSAVQCEFKNVLTLDQLNGTLTSYLTLTTQMLLTSKKEESLQFDLESFVELTELREKKIPLTAELKTLCQENFDLKPLLLAKSLELVENNCSSLNIDKLTVFPVKQLKQLKISLEKLLPDSEKCLASIEGYLNEFIKQSTEQVTRLKDDYSENREKLNVNGRKVTQEILNEASIYLHKLPVQELNSLKNLLELLEPQPQVYSDLNQLLVNFNTLKEEVNRETRVHLNLAEQTRLRKVAIDRVKVELDNYELNRQSRYPVKDLFFKADQESRSDFISGLKQPLDIYADSGESSPVLNYLKDKKFPGFNLQPIINRLNLVIKAHENTEKNQVEVNKSSKNIQAATILAALSNDFTWKDFSNRIKILNNKIEAIPMSLENGPDRTKAEDLRNLLSAEVDNFVIKHHELMLKRASTEEMQKLLDDFKASFECLLHSQDDSLSKYTSITTDIANIGLALLAVVTFGGSVLFSVWYSGSVFFKPDAIECINDAEQTANEISVPAA